MDISGPSLLLAATLVVVLDQATKALVVGRLGAGRVASISGIRIRRVINARVGRGLLGGRRTLVAFWIFVVVLLLALIQYAPGFQSDAARLSLGAAAGGAGSNVFDRLRHGGVIDYIDIGFWRVFNLADVAIVIGSIVACVAYFFELGG